MKNARLFLVTGKGGVGKTVTSLALANYLKSTTNKKIIYNSFDEVIDTDLCKTLGLTSLRLNITDSAIEFIGRKLRSETLARWIIKTPFFNALFNIVPSMGNMILMGHLIDLVEKRDDQIIVVDCPSSGHILTILESHLNFEKIFKTGPLVNDIARMKNFLANEEFVKTLVVSIPTELSIVEGQELKEDLLKMGLPKVTEVLNNIFSMNFKTGEDLPDFLKNKLISETELLESYGDNYSLKIPMFIESNTSLIIKDITNKISELFK